MLPTRSVEDFHLLSNVRAWHTKPLLDRAPRFADLIEGEPDDAAFTPLRRAELIGRPIGAPDFLETIARQLGRAVAPAKRGRKPKGARSEG